MKPMNIFLIILTSLFTFVGLLINKIYNKYIYENKFLQFILSFIFSCVALKFGYVIIKYLLGDIIHSIIPLFKHVKFTFTLEPSISLTIIGFIMLVLIANKIVETIERL